MIYVHLFFWLMVAHAFFDYPGQGDFLAQAKNRNTAIGKHIWMWALPSHALIHAGAVAFITGSLWLGMIEFIMHGFVDFLRCENRITYSQDQFIHVILKFAYVAYLSLGFVHSHGFFTFG